MQNKDRLRKKYFSIRKKKYFDIKPSFFTPIAQLIKKKFQKKNLYLSTYYPSSYEVNTNKLFETKIVDRLKIILPVIKENNEKNHSLFIYLNKDKKLLSFDFSQNYQISSFNHLDQLVESKTLDYSIDLL